MLICTACGKETDKPGRCERCSGTLIEKKFPTCATLFTQEAGKLKSFFDRGYQCITLEHSGETALILRPFAEENHYIIASGYNHETGTRKSAAYMDDLNEAYKYYLQECQKPMELSL
ncbi:MAG: hypothetical protein ACYC25_17210 [Paludibacter sp.]